MPVRDVPVGAKGGKKGGWGQTKKHPKGSPWGLMPRKAGKTGECYLHIFSKAV